MSGFRLLVCLSWLYDLCFFLFRFFRVRPHQPKNLRAMQVSRPVAVWPGSISYAQPSLQFPGDRRWCSHRNPKHTAASKSPGREEPVLRARLVIEQTTHPVPVSQLASAARIERHSRIPVVVFHFGGRNSSRNPRPDFWQPVAARLADFESLLQVPIASRGEETLPAQYPSPDPNPSNGHMRVPRPPGYGVRRALQTPPGGGSLRGYLRESSG